MRKGCVMVNFISHRVNIIHEAVDHIKEIRGGSRFIQGNTNLVLIKVPEIDTLFFSFGFNGSYIFQSYHDGIKEKIMAYFKTKLLKCLGKGLRKNCNSFCYIL